MIKNISKKKKNKGFTIIETMIAVALFLIVVTIGMDSLLNVSMLHAKSQDIRSIMDNLSFIMEDMSRNLRTGSNYDCMVVPASPSPDCTDGKEISFTSSDGTSQWIYMINSDNNIEKSIDGGATWVQLNSSEIKFSSSSGFSVVGAETAAEGDTQQPFITIRLIGNIIDKNKNIVTPFSLQTSVSQRLMDI